MRTPPKRFEEQVELYVSGEIDLYANAIVTACVPQGVYLELVGEGGEKLVLGYMDMLAKQKRVLNICLPWLTLAGIERFKRGARIMLNIMMGELRLGRVAPFPFVFEIRDDPVFYVSEFVKGTTLKKYIEEQQNLSLTDKLQLFKKLAEGLHLLHTYGAVHRDVKPQNIMIDESGNPKWIDFGIAMSQYENPLTRTEAQLGTPEYAAPEQLKDAGRVDQRADVYALSKVLYFMMTGKQDFNTEYLPRELMFCVPKAWQHDSERRQETVLEFLAEVIEAYPDINLSDEGYEAPVDFGPAQALKDLIILFGANPGKVRKITTLSTSEWDQLMDLSKKSIV